MPPHIRSTTSPQIETWALSDSADYLFKFVLLFSVFAAAVRSIFICSTRRKRRMIKADSPQEKESIPDRPSLEKEPNEYLQSLKQETLQPTLGPIYPWIAPPQPLPGPYDAPYYPLPLPTIRRHSQDSSAHDASPEKPEEASTISYTRRVSTNSIPEHETIIQGSTTVSTTGWRRTQWTVAAG
ncbi:hypothetical protein BKA66DRAFT_150941 [Pyrenochaeta sp. MPI-SDFR-AT-0127]|nr:hypothetical protein BKA66DRAFT_150941 [Pyrenochaeta sp. MPI-SDFR-AT-0127]